MNQVCCPISGETPSEERLNYFTHLLGFLGSVIGTFFLIFKFATTNLSFFSYTVYCFTLILVYGSSTLYHRSTCLIKKKILRTVDHSSIYLLIAGTYTPFTLGPLLEGEGLTLLSVEWGLAVIGIICKVVAFEKSRIFSLVAYLVMGWLIIFSIPTLIDQLNPASMLWLVSGGLLYSLGVIFYVWESLPFNHGIWHFFVLGGSICHFCSIACL